MHNTTWVEFSAEALRHNITTVRRLAPEAAILAMVKGNGYGHGANWVTQTLLQCQRPFCQGVAVARLNEAQRLREHYPSGRLLLLGTLVDLPLLEQCANLQLDLVVHNLASATLISKASLPAPLVIWLKHNVGMNRLGMNREDFIAAHKLLANCEQVSSLHHMSHFSEADDVNSEATAQQISRLTSLSKSLGEHPKSMANSAAIIAHPNSHAQWVRPGIMLYGDDPTGNLADTALAPVMRFKTRILDIHELAAGEGVGYNRRWRTTVPSRIATLAVGYADGYPRHAPDGTPVLIRGKRAPIAGRVSMDLSTIDVSHIPEAAIGDEVTLWGEGLSAAEVGQHCGTISYELFTRITDRVARIYD